MLIETEKKRRQQITEKIESHAQEGNDYCFFTWLPEEDILWLKSKDYIVDERDIGTYIVRWSSDNIKTK